MKPSLLAAIVTITLALIFYTVGVFSERRSGILKRSHVITFWLGLCFDTTGTTIMSHMAGDGSLFSAHGITGAIAIVLMLFHAVWATIVFARKDEAKQRSFHRFSIVVWAIWLIPYILGMMMGMSH
ncbi:MAG: HsmA family protein [Butyricicoccaceae bacterium]